MTTDLTALEIRVNQLVAELDAIKAARKPVVGETISTKDAYDLPRGAVVRDSDGDDWHANGEGEFSFSAEGLADEDWTGLNLADYQPLTLVSLPRDLEAEVNAEDGEDEDDVALPDWERELLAGTDAPTVGFQIGETVRLLPGASEAICAFSIGDYPEKVEIVRGEHFIRSHGECYEVRGLTGNNAGVVQTVPARFLESLKQPAPAADEIKVGDRVRVVETRPFGDASSIDGKTGVVTEIYTGDDWNPPGYVVKIDRDQGGYWATEHAGAPSVGKVEKLPAEPVLQAKEGDRVRVVKAYPGYMTDREGFIGRVSHVMSADRYLVEFEDGQSDGTWSLNYCTISASEVEIVPPREEPTSYSVSFTTAPPEPEPAKAPTQATIRQPLGSMEIFARKSGATSGVRLEIRSGEHRRAIHLDKAGTAELAATLQAIADA